jgi:nitroreductase
MSQLPRAEDHRKAEHPIESIFVRRWSPRAMSGEPISEAEMMSLFEAARWAPSTYNEQEWRFLYARRDAAQWPILFDLLVEGNRP